MCIDLSLEPLPAVPPWRIRGSARRIAVAKELCGGEVHRLKIKGAVHDAPGHGEGSVGC